MSGGHEPRSPDGGRTGVLGQAGRWLLRLDQELFERAARHRAPLFDQVLPRLTRAADHGKLWIAAAGCLAVAGGPAGRRAARRGLVAVAVTSLLANQLGKRWFGRRRPVLDGVPLGRRARRVPTSPSFPSGHAASAAAFATTVAATAPAAAVPIGVLAAGVAWSRVHTGMHYPADVAAGALLGTGAALLLSRTSRRS